VENYRQRWGPHAGQHRRNLSTIALWRLNAIFTRVLHLFSVPSCCPPCWQIQAGICRSIYAAGTQIHITGGASGTSTSPANKLGERSQSGSSLPRGGVELLFPAKIRNRSNTFIFVPNLSLCIWHMWPSAVAAENVCQR
jgi:hypothetical protein